MSRFPSQRTLRIVGQAHLRVVDERGTYEEPKKNQAPEETLPSLEQAFVRYGGYVAAIGLRLLGRFDEVEDLQQEVFLRAHRGWNQIRDPLALKGWLATIAVRVARKKLRQRRIALFLGVDRDYEYSTVPDGGASPEDQTLLMRIYEILDGLPVEQRLAWSLRHVEGETLPRVAELCGCSLATAKRRIEMAHIRLTGAIGHE